MIAHKRKFGNYMPNMILGAMATPRTGCYMGTPSGGARANRPPLVCTPSPRVRRRRGDHGPGCERPKT